MTSSPSSQGAASGAADDVALALTGVGKTFPNGTAAVADLSLSVARGEFLALLGPSGCGKSTVLRLMAGLDEPTAGTVVGVAGDEPGAQPAVGFVFQDPTLMPWASVATNVRLPLDLAGVAAAEGRRRAAEMIALVGLDGFASAYPRELSGGMRMRVSLARALVMQPRVLLMDEPFAALDEITRFSLNDELLALRARFDCTVVFVTHSTFESVYLADRIVVMSGRPGRVAGEIAVDAPQPRDAAFRGTAPFAAQCRQVFAALEAASGRSAA